MELRRKELDFSEIFRLCESNCTSKINELLEDLEKAVLEYKLKISSSSYNEKELLDLRDNSRQLEILSTSSSRRGTLNNEDLKKQQLISNKKSSELLKKITPISKNSFLSFKSIISGHDGRFRKEPVFIKKQGGTLKDAFPSPDHNLVEDLLLKTCDFLNNDNLNLIYRALTGFFIFEIIHPFMDANGRVGRLFVHLYFERFVNLIPAENALQFEYPVPPVGIAICANMPKFNQLRPDFIQGNIEPWFLFSVPTIKLAFEKALDFYATI